MFVCNPVTTHIYTYNKNSIAMQLLLPFTCHEGKLVDNLFSNMLISCKLNVLDELELSVMLKNSF